MTQVSVAMGRILSPTSRTVGRLRDAAAFGLNLLPAAKRWIAEMRYKPKPRFHAGALVAATGPAASRSPVGQMFLQPRVDTRDHHDLLLDDVLGPWFSVLTWGNDPRAVLDKPALATLARLGVRLVSVRPTTQLHWDPPHPAHTDGADVTVVGDRTGQLKKWFDDHQVGVAVIRPDRYVAAAALAQDASRVTTALAEALSLTPEEAPDDARPLLHVTQPAAGTR
jgi:3-(3-hydroxy-phenyl)propionate hydroxylase